MEDRNKAAEYNLYIEAVRENESGKEEVVEKREYHNITVDNAAVLQARRFQPTGAIANGFQYIAVGVGYGTGTVENPEIPGESDTVLRDEIDRREIDSWEYLTPEHAVSGSPTNILQLHVLFDYGDALMPGENPASIVELGLFGGDASAAEDSGQLFAYRTFGMISKTSDLKFRIRWVVTFNAR